MSRESSESLQYIPVSKLQAGNNIRKQRCEEDDRGLLESMVKNGQIQPLRARPMGGLFDVYEGGRRLEMGSAAGLTEMAVIVDAEETSDATAKLRALVSNCQRTDLSAVDVAEAIRDVMAETGWTAAEIAAHLGFSQSKVSRLLSLLRLLDPIKEQVRAGLIPESVGGELARIEEPAAQAALAARIASEGMTRDSVSHAVRRRKMPPKETTGRPLSRVKAELSGGRSVTLAGANLDSVEVFIEWLEELLFKVRKLRPKGWELATIIKTLKDEAKP